MARPLKNHQNKMIFNNTILVTSDGEVRKETVDQEFQSGIAALQKLNEKPKFELSVIKPEKRKVANVGSRNDNAEDDITKKNLKTLRLKSPRVKKEISSELTLCIVSEVHASNGNFRKAKIENIYRTVFENHVLPWMWVCFSITNLYH